MFFITLLIGLVLVQGNRIDWTIALTIISIGCNVGRRLNITPHWRISFQGEVILVSAIFEKNVKGKDVDDVGFGGHIDFNVSRCLAMMTTHQWHRWSCIIPICVGIQLGLYPAQLVLVLNAKQVAFRILFGHHIN